MNPISENPGRKLPFSGSHTPMDNRTLYFTLALSAFFAFLFILAVYVGKFGGNPINRVGFGLLLSIPPALGALLVVKLTRVFESWLGAVSVYVALFVLAIVIQAFGRTIQI